MSIFNKELVERPLTVADFYTIEIENAAYHSLEGNLVRIFKIRVPRDKSKSRLYNITMQHNDYVKAQLIQKKIMDYFSNMSLIEFKALLLEFLKDKGNGWKNERHLHRFLRKKLGVRREYLRDAHTWFAEIHGSVWGGRYAIYIPNGEAIEHATADGIKIVFKKKK